MTDHQLHMQRALDIAVRGSGKVSPNPLVGCVIVRHGKIIGEGWHEQFGRPHAEINALRTVDDKSLLKECTLYVNLEPCSHFGKTPPCADALIEAGIPEVVVGCGDPNPKVNGQGVARLQAAGVRVITGILEQESIELNRRFITRITQGRPWIILKWAQTADGFLARSNFNSKWISNPSSRQMVHAWRTEEDAVLVGARTALYDNPKLSVRDWPGRNPVRVVIDPKKNLPEHLCLFDGSQPTLVYTIDHQASVESTEWIALREHQASGFTLSMLHDLACRNVSSILVEGGAVTLTELIKLDLWDEARIFTAPKKFGEGIAAPALSRSSKILEIKIEEDRLEVFRKMI